MTPHRTLKTLSALLATALLAPAAAAITASQAEATRIDGATSTLSLNDFAGADFLCLSYEVICTSRMCIYVPSVKTVGEFCASCAVKCGGDPAACKWNTDLECTCRCKAADAPILGADTLVIES